MKYKELLTDLAANLNDGDSTRVICPFCKDTSENTMSLTRNVAAILYHCYRASCGKSGVIGAPVNKSKSKKEFKPKIFDKEVFTAIGFSGASNAPAAEYLAKYEIFWDTSIIEEIGWLLEERRIVFPLFNLMGYKWGTLTKAIDKNIKPKTILYKEQDWPSIHFPVMCASGGETLILVEDVISSIKLSTYIPCASLLGTHLSEEMVMYLKSLNYKEIRLMFDRDATAKALGYVNKYKGVLNLSVLEVSKPYSDPKDIPRKELEEMFK